VEESSIDYLSTTDRFKTLLQRANNNVLDLLLQAATNQKLQKQLSAPEYDGLWQLRYQETAAWDITTPLIPPEITPVFYNYAITVLNQRGHGEAVIQYLETLAQAPYFNFHAAKVIVNHCLTQAKNNKENLEQTTHDVLKKACKYATIAAENHLVPGYLLYAHAHYWSARIFEQSNNPHNKPLADAHYISAYKQLLIAQTLLADEHVEPYCEEKITSAYAGKGLAASNHWGFDSIDKIIFELLRYFNEAGLTLATHDAKIHAKTEAQTIIDRYSQLPAHRQGTGSLQFF
jgi:Family of unknown function (DUF5630)